MKNGLIIVVLIVAAAGLGGCEKALFPENLPRTQYERYDRLRGRYVPKDQQNNYGGAEPALRPRLTPYQQ
ncbi:hypothetical protein HED60_22075 [Planctomycetales bacterium ZRK34]|nr:hypothetical protein HED60_22075 [Planctomycetales bacterium ZRK34]